MKVLACSDFQLGSGAEYGTPEQPRLRDQAEALDLITEYALEEDCSLILFLGDAFQHRRPGIDELLVFGRWANSLTHEVLLLAGNHDVRGPGLPTTLDLFGDTTDEHGEPNVYVRPGVTVRQLPGERPVAFAFMPWAHPGSLRAALGPQDPPEHAEALLKVAEGLRADIEKEEPGAYAVLCTHYALSGMSIPSGLPTSELGEPILDAQALLAQGWQWVLAGHVHAPGGVAAPTGRQAISLGSPYVCDFGEAEGEHGVWVLDTGADTLEFLPLPGRRFVTLSADAEAVADALASPDYELEDIAGVTDLTGAVVRLRIGASEEQAARLDLAALRRALYVEGAHKVYAVQLDVQRPTRARAEGLAEDTEPLAALEAWIEAMPSVSPQEGERLRALTRSYLEEVSR